MTCMVSSRPKKGTGLFLNFLFAAKCLIVHVSLRLLNNVSGVYQSRFL